MENMRRERVSTSGIRGVSRHSASGKWKVTVIHDGVAHHGGFFGNLHKAEAAAVALRNKLYTHNDSDNPEREVLRVRAMYDSFEERVRAYREEAPEDVDPYYTCPNCLQRVWHFATSVAGYLACMDRHDELCEAA